MLFLVLNLATGSVQVVLIILFFPDICPFNPCFHKSIAPCLAYVFFKQATLTILNGKALYSNILLYVRNSARYFNCISAFIIFINIVKA